MPAGQPTEVQFPFSIDLTRFVSSIDQAQQQIAGLSTTVTNAQTQMQAAFNGTARAEAQVTAVTTQATQATQAQAAAVGNLTQVTARQATTATQAANTTTAATTRATAAITAQTAATTRAVGAQNAFARGYGVIARAANILPGLGISGAFLLIFEGIMAAANAMGVFADETKDFSETGKQFQKELEGTGKAALEAQTQLSILTTRVQDSSASFEDKQAALKDYNREFGETIGYAKDINHLEQILIDKAPEYIKMLGQKARAQAASNLITKESEKQLQKEIELGEKSFDLLTNTGLGIQDLLQPGSRAGYVEKLSEEITGIGKNIDNLLKIGAKAETEADRIAKQNGFTDKADLADRKKSEAERDKLLKARADAEEKRRKKEADQLKAYNDLMAKLLGDEAGLKAKANPDERLQALAVSDAKFDQLKADRKKEIDEAKVTAQQRLDLLKEYAKFEIDVNKAKGQAQVDINKKYDDELVKQQQAALKVIAELGETAQDEEINKIRQAYIERASVIQAAGELTADVRRKLAENEAREIDTVNIKYGSERIKKATELEIAGIKVAEKYQGESVKIEREKQVKILEAQLFGAEEYMKLLTLNGKTINDLEVRQAQEVINNFKQAIKNANKGAGEQSLFEFLGISEDGQKDIEKYGEAAQAAGKIVSDFAQTFVDGYERQLRAKQALIDQDNKEIDELQARLEKEQELKDQGFANDVDRLQSELGAKKAQREEDLKQAEEIEKKRQAMQKVALIADTVSQASNLITASAGIFKSFSALGPFGVPLAITTIGVMLAAFAAAKIQAFKAIGETKTFGEGGEVDGESHSRGGKKYYANDGSGDVTELEGGEYVVNKRSTRRAKQMIAAINDGTFFNMHPETLEHMLAGMNISLPKDQPQQMIMHVAQRDEAVRQAAFTGGNPAIDNINSNVQYLADKKRSEVLHWNDGKYNYRKEGNLITKTPIK